MSKLSRHWVFVSLNCYFTIRFFQNELIWKSWCTFACKFQKRKRHGSNINWAQYLRGNRLAASLVEELLMSFNSFVTKMKEMASISNDKSLANGWIIKTCAKCWTSAPEHYKHFVTMERWPFLKSTVRCTISLRMWRGFFMLWLVEIRIARCVISKRAVYEWIDNAT